MLTLSFHHVPLLCITGFSLPLLQKRRTQFPSTALLGEVLTPILILPSCLSLVSAVPLASFFPPFPLSCSAGHTRTRGIDAEFLRAPQPHASGAVGPPPAGKLVDIAPPPCTHCVPLTAQMGIFFKFFISGETCKTSGKRLPEKRVGAVGRQVGGRAVQFSLSWLLIVRCALGTSCAGDLERGRCCKGESTQILVRGFT